MSGHSGSPPPRTRASTYLRQGLVIALIAFAALIGLVLVVVWNRADDTSLYIRNASKSTWYLAVDKEEAGHPYTTVVQVAPGADTFGLSWRGGWPKVVRVLDANCTQVGTFEGDVDGLTVEGAAGLTGRTESHGPPVRSREGTGVDGTQDCGGAVFALGPRRVTFPDAE
jgi:hypothetical protein